MPTTDKIAAKDRQASRDSLYLNTELLVEDLEEALIARVRNLSSGGMMVEGNPALQLGVKVTAELRGIGSVPGEVVWSSPQRAGIAFDVEVDPKQARYPLAPKTERIVYGKPFDYTSRPGLKTR